MTLPGTGLRRLVAIGLAVGLVAAACGSSTSVPNLPGNLPGTTAGNGGTGGSSLISGLSSNLDTLTSCQFTESVSGSQTGGAATPADTGSLQITGTVINTPTKSMSLNAYGAQYVVIGTQGWTSGDNGSTWMATGATSATLTSLLPNNYYGTWFDTNATNFKVQGDETKNGVQCVHYKGDSSLGSVYSAIAGVSANFQADLWVAKDGNYPVSGIYGFSASSGGQAGSFGFSFDITHINDASNKVTQPANVVAVPT